MIASGGGEPSIALAKIVLAAHLRENDERNSGAQSIQTHTHAMCIATSSIVLRQ